MTREISATSDDLIARLTTLGDLRVWSVIITIFGDAVMPRGGTVSASALSALTARLNIKPEALRVALFRLAKDGWITRAKSGRNSFYRLSERGRREFLPASRRIYADAPKLHGPWRLALLPPGTEQDRAALDQGMRDLGFLPVASGAYLGPAQAGDAPRQVLTVTGMLRDAPRWTRAELGPDALQRDYVRLESTLLTCQRSLPAIADLPGADAAALRIILIHQWRRLLLRHADVPPEVLPENWRGEACRTAVLDLHRTLSDRADPWLDGAIGKRG
ncbi:MAG: hypothetical protein LJE68_10895 [Rhodobacter sp.]|nr:hypothetical protein [Rhodobacter sp.]